MKTFLFLSALVSLGSLQFAHGTSVTFGSTGSARTVFEANGTTQLASGDLVWMGTFASEAFAFNPLFSVATNVSAITTAGGWEQFSIDTSTDTLNPGATSTLQITATGKAGGSVVDNNGGATQAAFFNGKNVYLWIFDAPTVGAATQMGIFRAPNADAVVDWIFPNNAGGVGDTITLSTTATGAPTINSIGGAGTSNSTQLILSAAGVPEPSSAVLIGVAVLGLLGMRRRSFKKI